MFFAIGVHALVDIPAVLYQIRVLKLVTTEVITRFFCVALITAALTIHRKLGAPASLPRK
jgi:uncharacterized membrane protein YhfC